MVGSCLFWVGRLALVYWPIAGKKARWPAALCERDLNLEFTVFGELQMNSRLLIRASRFWRLCKLFLRPL